MFCNAEETGASGVSVANGVGGCPKEMVSPSAGTPAVAATCSNSWPSEASGATVMVDAPPGSRKRKVSVIGVAAEGTWGRVGWHEKSPRR